MHASQCVDSGHGVAVTPDYVAACERAGRRLPEADFAVQPPARSSLPAAAKHHDNDSNNPLGLPAAVRLPNVFTGLRFRIDPSVVSPSSGKDDADDQLLRRQLRRVIYAGNGTLAGDNDATDGLKTYRVVSDQSWARTSGSAGGDDNDGNTRVPVSWVFDSYRAGTLLPL